MSETTETEIVIQENKKNTTKITAIVVLSVVFALALFILISSVAMVGLNPNFVARPDEIYIYESGATRPSGQITKDDELYDDFMEYYDGMFSSSFLSALFNGRLSGYSLSTREYLGSTKIYSNFENPYVKFKYDNEIELTYKNGGKYESYNNTEKNVTFKELYFELSEINSLQEFTIYVIDYDASQTTGKTYCIKANLVANTSDLYSNFSNFYNSKIG